MLIAREQPQFLYPNAPRLHVAIFGKELVFHAHISFIARSMNIY